MKLGVYIKGVITGFFFSKGYKWSRQDNSKDCEMRLRKIGALLVCLGLCV